MVTAQNWIDTVSSPFVKGALDVMAEDKIVWPRLSAGIDTVSTGLLPASVRAAL